MIRSSGTSFLIHWSSGLGRGAAPYHPYTEALLSANPEPDPDARLSRVELKGEIPSLMSRPQGCEFHTRCIYVQKDKCHHLSEAEPGHTYTCHYPIPGWHEDAHRAATR
jgi:oligopeptide/dipeptide ABC transporter ATP-binding protein